MHLMRSLSKDYRLQALSLPEITEEFEALALRLARTQEFQGRKLKPGPLLNAIVLHFLALPDAERGRIAADQLGRLEAMLDDEPAAQGRSVDLTATSAIDPPPDRVETTDPGNVTRRAARPPSRRKGKTA